MSDMVEFPLPYFFSKIQNFKYESELPLLWRGDVAREVAREVTREREDTNDRRSFSSITRSDITCNTAIKYKFF